MVTEARHSGDHFIMYINIKQLCCAFEIYMMYVNYTQSHTGKFKYMQFCDIINEMEIIGGEKGQF